MLFLCHLLIDFLLLFFCICCTTTTHLLWLSLLFYQHLSLLVDVKCLRFYVVASDPDGAEEVGIYLCGRQAEWEYDLKRKSGKMWEFFLLRVECTSLHYDTTID